MTGNDHHPPEGIDAPRLVRPFVITNGRGLPEDDRFQLTTLVTSAGDDRQRPTQQSPEAARLIGLCARGYLSVAEIAAHLHLPVGVVKILLSDLTEHGYLITRPPVPPAELVDTQLLQDVIDGLRAQLG